MTNLKAHQQNNVFWIITSEEEIKRNKEADSMLYSTASPWGAGRGDITRVAGQMRFTDKKNLSRERINFLNTSGRLNYYGCHNKGIREHILLLCLLIILPFPSQISTSY